jgi:hypothetical protein
LKGSQRVGDLVPHLFVQGIQRIRSLESGAPDVALSLELDELIVGHFIAPAQSQWCGCF